MFSQNYLLPFNTHSLGDSEIRTELRNLPDPLHRLLSALVCLSSSDLQSTGVVGSTPSSHARGRRRANFVVIFFQDELCASAAATLGSSQQQQCSRVHMCGTSEVYPLCSCLSVVTHLHLLPQSRDTPPHGRKFSHNDHILNLNYFHPTTATTTTVMPNFVLGSRWSASFC